MGITEGAHVADGRRECVGTSDGDGDGTAVSVGAGDTVV